MVFESYWETVYEIEWVSVSNYCTNAHRHAELAGNQCSNVRIEETVVSQWDKV